MSCCAQRNPGVAGHSGGKSRIGERTLGEYVLLKSSVFGSLEAVIVDAQQDLTNKEKRLEARWGADRGGWLGDDGGMQQVQ